MIIHMYTEQNNVEDYVAFDRNNKESAFYLQGISRFVKGIAKSDGQVVLWANGQGAVAGVGRKGFPTD